MAGSWSKCLLLASAAMFVAGAPARAQDATTATTPPGGEGQDPSPMVTAPGGEAGVSDSNDDIVVTGVLQAYRGNVPLRELPQATQVLSVATLQQLNITRLDTALDLSASVSRQNAFGGLFDAFAIRGFVGDPNTPSGFLVNGFNGARGYGGTRDTASVEAIEILRGPTSALFGRGEPGGAVNIVTKKPKLGDAGGYLIGSAGRFDTYRGEADYNLPLTDTLAARVTASYEDADSFRDTLHRSRLSLTPTLLFKSGDFTANYELEYTRQRIPFDRGIMAINGDLGALPRSRFLGEPSDGNNLAKSIGQQLQVEQKLSADWKLLGGIAYRYTSLEGFGEDPEFAAGRDPVFTAGVITGPILSRRRIFRDYTGKDLIPRLELSGSFNTGGIKHNLLMGGDYEWFKLDIRQTRFRPPTLASLTAAQRAEIASGNPSAATLRRINGINIFNPVYSDVTTLTMSPFQSRIEVAKAWGVYLRDRIELTDWLALQAGIRYDEYKQDVNNRLTTVQTSQDFTKFSPSLGISAKATEDLTFYGSFSKGFRANTGVNVRNEAFKPETSQSYEVGAKFDLMDKMLTGTVALFKMKKSNVLTGDPVNAGFSLDVGKARSKGLEVDLNAKLPSDITVIVSYAYVDAEIAEDILDPDFGRTILEGDRLINIPKNSFALLASKDFQIGERLITVGGDVKYTSSRLGETGTTYTLPGYTLVRAFGSVDLTDRLTLSGDIYNLFNIHYYPSSYAALWTAPGEPRTWTARVKYRF